MPRTLNHNSENHYLQSQYNDTPTLIEEPIGWQFQDRKMSRAKKSGEMIEKSAKSLQFIGIGRTYIIDNDNLYGNELKMKYIIITENPRDASDVIKEVYFLDLASLKDGKGKLAVNIEEGGLSKLIKSKGNDKFEIDRRKDITGKRITKLDLDELTLKGRKILLRSELETKNELKKVKINFTKNKVAIITDIKTSNHIGNIFPVSNPTPFSNWADVSDCFFRENKVNKTLNIRVKGSVSCDVTNLRGLYGLKIKLGVHKDGVLLYSRDLAVGSRYIGNINTININIDNTQIIHLKKDERICVYYEGLYSGVSSTFPKIKENITISLVEDSEIAPSKTKCLHPHEAIERALEIITGSKNKFKSNFLGRKSKGYKKDGPGAYSMIYPLLWVRGLEMLTEKKPSISLNELVGSINAIWGCSSMVEVNGFEQKLRLEPVNFFYSPYTTIVLPEIVEDLEKEYAKGFMHTSYTVGYKKGGADYEEAVGIGDVNGQSNFTTIRTTKEQNMKILSSLRADVYAEEFARRKTSTQEDTKYDFDWFVKDCKYSNGLKERTPSDDFSKVRKIYDIDSATNLRFSPRQMLERNSFFIKGNLDSYKETDIVFTSSNCNTELELTKHNGKKTKENEDINVGSLGKSFFKPYYITFNHPVTFEIKKQLRAKQIINGEEVYNFYGKLKFQIKKDVWLKGYIIEVDEVKGSWKVLMAN